MTNARHDAFLKELRHEFGAEGFQIWWCLVEYIAEALKESNPRPHILATPQTFAEECFSTVKNVEKVLNFAKKAVHGVKIQFRKRRGKWSVEIPKVLEFRDEHSRKEGIGSGATPELLRSNSHRTRTRTRKRVRGTAHPARPNGPTATVNPDPKCRVCKGLGMVTRKVGEHKSRALPCQCVKIRQPSKK